MKISIVIDKKNEDKFLNYFSEFSLIETEIDNKSQSLNMDLSDLIKFAIEHKDNGTATVFIWQLFNLLKKYWEINSDKTPIQIEIDDKKLVIPSTLSDEKLKMLLENFGKHFEK